MQCIEGLALFIQPFQNFINLRRLVKDPLGVVFYSEGKHHWPHLGPIAQELAENRDTPVTYVVSEPDDPAIAAHSANFQVFNIGRGSARTILYAALDAKILVSSLPDLGLFHLKRSKHDVHYAYVHHSLMSTHTIYRERAFDSFDSIFCSGPHHVTEIRNAENLRDLSPRKLIPHGYARLDSMLAQTHPQSRKEAGTAPPSVLIAPSWGPGTILENEPLATELVAGLLAAGYRTTVRPHPMTQRSARSTLKNLAARFGAAPGFRLDNDISGTETLAAADLMISDWSGAALEFALAYERPVLFVDTPQKIRNPHYRQNEAVPIEETLRRQIGDVLVPNDLSRLKDVTDGLIENRADIAAHIRNNRHDWVFNIGRSAAIAADEILNICANTAK